MSAAIYDAMTGDVICEGLDGCRISDVAARAAERIAAERGEPVLLVDDDGTCLAYPDGTFRCADGSDA